MALQNTRAYLFRGEDLAVGGASAKEVTQTSTAVATARPLLYSLGFYGQTTQLNNVLGSADKPAAAQAGLSRVLVNRSGQYWMSLVAQIAAGNASLQTLTVNLPLAPRQALFLPSHLFAGGTSVISADSAWPLVLAPSQAAGSPPMTAGTSAMISFDYLAEQ